LDEDCPDGLPPQAAKSARSARAFRFACLSGGESAGASEPSRAAFENVDLQYSNDFASRQTGSLRTTAGRGSRLFSRKTRRPTVKTQIGHSG
jgi:hypothetical protein